MKDAVGGHYPKNIHRGKWSITGFASGARMKN
jgi:hypothetical protein